MDRQGVFNRIARQTGLQPVSCDCQKCRDMCKRTPCLGTPHDILAIIDAGYEDKVCYTEWAAGMVLGHIKRPITMVGIKTTSVGEYDGCCVFFHDGKCELHESGLKPTEGKLSHHDFSPRELLPQYNLTFQVAKEWTLTENLGLIQEIVRKLCNYLDKKEYEQGRT